MSEQTTELGRITRTLGKLNPYSAERRKRRESEATAKEALLLFSAQEHQEPLATYYADSESEFDLTQQKPGTIFRVQGLSTLPFGETFRPPFTGSTAAITYFW